MDIQKYAFIKRNTAEETMAREAAGGLSKVESDYIAAFSGDEQTLKKLANDLGIKKKDANADWSTIAEQIQSVLNVKLQRAQRAFTACMQALNAGHDMMMRVINMLKA